MQNKFFDDLKKIQPDAAVFLSHEPRQVSQGDRPRSTTLRKLPSPLSSLHKREYEKLNKDSLDDLCRDMFEKGVISLSLDEASYLEESTRLQAQSMLWFEQRTGRITASKFYAVSRARLDPPPSHLLKRILKPTRESSAVAAIQWGIKNESAACEMYIEQAMEAHVNFSYEPAGLYVNHCSPHLEASPDGHISCDCCGEGLIEIKCTYKYRHVDPCTIDDPSFYLKKSETGHLQLDRNHEYYYQVQGQLALCEKEYSDFICWSPEGLFVERIVADPSFFSELQTKLDVFFVKVVLPQLLTGCTMFDNEKSPEASQPSSSQSGNVSDTSYCWCHQGESGRMIACDNPNCAIEWFHFECAGLTRKPRGNWFCSDSCRRAVQ